MTTTAPLLRLDMAGVARLARVQRPVVSMWRSRFSSGLDAFPRPIDEAAGRPQFDAEAVADWLARTGRGKNAQPREDAAAAATPPDFSYGDSHAVAELEAIIALSPHADELESLTGQKLTEIAAAVDPGDTHLRREIEAHAKRGAPWIDFAAHLIDAAYSPGAALEIVARARAAHRGVEGSAGPLARGVVDLLVELTRELSAGSEVTVVLDARDVEFSSALAAALAEDVTLALPAEDQARRVRRRLSTDGQWITLVGDADEAEGSRSVRVARVPATPGDSTSAMLRAVDDIALGLRAEDSAIVVGPARALADRLGTEDEHARADILRTGRVRGIVRFPVGLIASASREALALWVLGDAQQGIAPSERVTALADLADSSLSPATRSDLVSDLASSIHGGKALHDRAFRFARFAKTTTLQARSGSLVAHASRTRALPYKRADLPALIDAAADAVRDDLAPIAVAPSEQTPLSRATVEAMVSAKHLRVISGLRLHEDLLGSEGLVVVDAKDLDTPSRIGDVRVDQFTFAEHHPTAALTRPGDVIFRTSPTAAAWVDPDGSKIVAYPARVLRVRASDPGGLVPEVIAADIADAPGGPAAWKRWMLNRVDPGATVPLRTALHNIKAARADLLARAARLDDFSALLIAGVASGTVSMITVPTAADAAATE